jgi:hypothetical protein
MLQTFGAGSYTNDWDFTQFVPDALVINLGTNDFDHDSGPAWEANFTSTFIDFVVCPLPSCLLVQEGGGRSPVVLPLHTAPSHIRTHMRGPAALVMPPSPPRVRAFSQVNATRYYDTTDIHFFIGQGPMNDGAPLYNCLQNVIANVTAQGLHASFLDMRGPATDGCNGHPGRRGHYEMFEMAQPQIATAMGW